MAVRSDYTRILYDQTMNANLGAFVWNISNISPCYLPVSFLSTRLRLQPGSVDMMAPSLFNI